MSNQWIKITDVRQFWEIEIFTSQVNQSYSIMLFGTDPNFYIDWGDGSPPTISINTIINTKTYSSPGLYKIRFHGSFGAEDGNIELGLNNTDKDLLYSTSILPQIPGLVSLRNTFLNSNLSDIPDKLLINNSRINDVQNCFYGSDVGNIPNDLFSYTPLITNFAGCFTNTNIVSIPSNIFSNCPEALDFQYCFFSTNIVEIPQTIFQNNKKATNFSNCFRQCPINIIPAIFSENRLATNFTSCFDGCSSVTFVDYNIFINNVKADSFSSTFNNVTMSTSNYTSLLIALASNARERLNDITFWGGNSRYTSQASTARQILTNKNWTFVDLGLQT